MSAVTTTMVVASSPVEVIPYRLHLLSFKEKLFEIIKKHDHSYWQDSTSIRLRKWCIKVLRLGLDIEDESSYATVVAKKLKTLYSILGNPFNPGEPVKIPIRDRNQLWDKDCLQEYKAKVGPISPFDLQPIQEEPHVFAEEILNWARSLPKADSHALVVSNPSHLFSLQNAPMLFALLTIAQQCVKVQAVRNEARKDLIQIKKEIEVHKKGNEALLTQFQAAAAAQTATIKKSFDAQTESNRKALEEQSKHTADVKNDLNQTKKELTTSQQEIAHFKMQVTQLEENYKQKSNEVNELQREVDRLKKKDCIIM